MITFYLSLSNCFRQDLISPLSTLRSQGILIIYSLSNCYSKVDVFIINRHQEVLCTELQSVGNLKLSKCFLIVVKMWTKETRFKSIPIVEINVQTCVFLVSYFILLFCVELLLRIAL